MNFETSRKSCYELFKYSEIKTIFRKLKILFEEQ